MSEEDAAGLEDPVLGGPLLGEQHAPISEGLASGMCVMFGTIWNEIIDHFRLEDIKSGQERELLKFSHFDGFSQAINLPVKQLTFALAWKMDSCGMMRMPPINLMKFLKTVPQDDFSDVIIITIFIAYNDFLMVTNIENIFPSIEMLLTTVCG
jgi:hypothetical protein